MRNIFLGSNNTRPPKEILYYWFEYLSITNRRYNYIKVISSNDTSTTYNDNYLVQDTPRQPNQTGIRTILYRAVRPPLLNRQNSEYNRVVCACTNTGPYHFFYSVITCITKPYSIMLYYLPMFFHPTAADYNKNITTLLNEIIYPTNIVRTGSKVVNLYLFEDIKLKRWKNNRFLNLIDYFLIKNNTKISKIRTLVQWLVILTMTNTSWKVKDSFGSSTSVTIKAPANPSPQYLCAIPQTFYRTFRNSTFLISFGNRWTNNYCLLIPIQIITLSVLSYPHYYIIQSFVSIILPDNPNPMVVEINFYNKNSFVNPLINPWRFVFSDSNKLTLFITKVFGYRPGNNSSTFNVSTHEGAGTFQALANKELTSPKANWASGL
ncbi:hypothetical protein H8356DRAFT_1428669 [Neocallimastix lanati (nom. inval.)]|nr:hypothetical protein H8356DRAFT_1428669 [Neocallimastix sp. JGI-2020a]